MITEIAGALWEGLKGAVAWMTGYAKADAKKAREMNDDKNKLDYFRNDIAKEDLDEIRKKLS